MYTFTFALIFAAGLVAIYADEKKEHREVFEKCAEANGMKMDPEKRKEMHERRKNGEKIDGSPPPQFECMMKCVLEELGVISNGKIDLEKAKGTHVFKINEKNEDCLKAIEIKECPDMKKLKDC